MLQDVLQTETRKIPHTYTRNGIYYLRYRVPKVIRNFTGLPAVLRQSLNTRSPDVAENLLRIVVSKIQEVKGVLMAKQLENTLKMEFMTILTNDGVVTIDFNDPAKEAAFANVILNPKQDIKSTEQEAESEMTISDSVRNYMIWRENLRNKDGSLGLSDSSRNARSRNFDILLEVLGDIGIAKVTPHKIREVLDVIRNMPRCNKAPYTGWDLKDVIGAAKSRMVPESDLVASKQAKEALKDYQSLFSRFLTDERGFLKDAPTKGVRAEFESSSYAPLSSAQMTSVVKYWKKQPSSDYKWIMLLAAYTGARRGDVFNLKISSLKHDKDCGRFYLFIEEGKTDAARRKIPLHNNLIELGFLDFYKSKKAGVTSEDRLFRDFKSDQYITSKFRESLDVLGLPRADHDLRRYSFHSMRHSVITEAVKNHVSMPVIQRVVGHEITGAGITKLYTGEFELKDMLCVIDSLSW